MRDCFPWTVVDRDVPISEQTDGVPIEVVALASDLNLDPKRHSEKYRVLKQKIEKEAYFRLGDVLHVVQEKRAPIGAAKTYKYVEIEKVGVGEYDYVELKGWQLPDRAKLEAKPGDIFIPHLWSCAGKWFIAAGDCDGVLVTNGCTRLRINEGYERFLPDLGVGLCSEAFSVQLRALCTGSDGLAEISDVDILQDNMRGEASAQLDLVLLGRNRFSKFAQQIIQASLAFPRPPARKSHVVLV